MKKRIRASEAARSFSEIVNRVHYRGESFIVERGGKPVCEIVPVAPVKFTVNDLVDLLRTLPRPDDEYLRITEDLINNQPPAEDFRWPD
ncbi:MAG: type II toxin-antitoxin system Phd/YefM family antitoxin [Terriglobales bacterium]